VGFLHPDKVGEDQWVYSAHDLHAWPEMYFDGVGWVRFEPTPDDRAGAIPGYTTGQFNTPQPTDVPSGTAPTERPDEVAPDRQDSEAGAGVPGGGSDGGSTGAWLLALLALLGVLAAPRLIRSLVRHRRWATAETAQEAAEAGWRELRDVALDLRLPWEESVTLRTRAGVLAEAFSRPGTEERAGHVRGSVRGPGANPEATRALERLVHDVELARYSRRGTGTGGRTAQSVRADQEACAQALRAGTGRRRRRAGLWLPASLVRNNNAWRSLLGRGSSPRPATWAEAGVDRPA
jgi:hypothetical protein